jgi:hypothetical protein
MKKCTEYKNHKTAAKTMGLLTFGPLLFSSTSIHIMKPSIDTRIRTGRCELQCVTARARLLAVLIRFMVYMSVTSTYVISFLSIYVQPNRKEQDYKQVKLGNL